MASNENIRWKQRLFSFDAALIQLKEACSLDSYSRLERAGLIKTFEFCYELCWNVLKDLLLYEGYQAKVPREAIRKGYEAGYINEQDSETLLEAVDLRNITSHTYRESAAIKAETLIKDIYLPIFLRVHFKLNSRADQ
ncbi:MAG: HI0074 family nucleotidyltransferase substrate-binding subunit [Gammaproteobacteria bacterium]|nr:HI0074 family nucleotidyltransferase substrate-binding subunit [Gammaproteobacteria bacterium]